MQCLRLHVALLLYMLFESALCVALLPYMLFESALLSDLVGNCAVSAPSAPAEVFFMVVVFAVRFCFGSVARVTAGSPLRR